MDAIKDILYICSCLFLFIVVATFCSFFNDLWCRFSWRKQPIPWMQYNPFFWLYEPQTEKSLGARLFPVVLTLTLIAGLVNIVLGYTLASTNIGAFYEKSDYTEEYEAALYIEDKAIFCIVTVVAYSDGGNLKYDISEVLLPYGASKFTDEEYDPENNCATVSLGDMGYDCKLTLKGPASESSYNILENTVVSNYGEFCASKRSESYHLLSCRHAKKIKPYNFVYFKTQYEAEVLGFKFCSVCSASY